MHVNNSTLQNDHYFSVALCILIIKVSAGPLPAAPFSTSISVKSEGSKQVFAHETMAMREYVISKKQKRAKDQY